MTILLSDFLKLPMKAKHEALRDFFDASALKWPEGSEQRSVREELAWREDRYVQAIERREARQGAANRGLAQINK